MAGIGSSAIFTVTRKESELVSPAMPTPQELKQLSDIDDNQALRFNISTIFFYKSNPSMDGRDPVRVIKEALAKALVYYYPLAGRLVEESNKKLSVDCNAEGLLFIEASANITLDQLGDTILSPDQYLDEVLHNVPGSDDVIGCPIILVQVTRLVCGGFILALRLNHTMCDGVGFTQFLQAVAEIARGAMVPSIFPVWQRELLNAREQPRITNEKEEKAVNSFSTNDTDDVLQRSFLMTPDFVKRIRGHLPLHLTKCTSYELLTACLWKCVAQALKRDPEKPVYAVVVISARNKKYNANIPLGYYGNAVACPIAVSKSMHLCEKPLAYAVELVKGVKSVMSADYFRSMIESSVARGLPRVDPSGFFVISDARFFGEINFGWGQPVYATPVIKRPMACHLSKYKNIEGSESIVAVINLPAQVMYRFEQELKKMMATNTQSKL